MQPLLDNISRHEPNDWHRIVAVYLVPALKLRIGMIRKWLLITISKYDT